MYNVSIIIPHYNTPTLLWNLVKSIGFHDDVEVIVIDDHSNKEIEKYKECVREFSQRNNSVFLKKKKKKKGAGSARNVGLRAARGKWLLFADADDIFLDTMYETISEFFDNKSDIVFFPPHIDEKKEIRDVVKSYRQICNAYTEGVVGAETLLRYQFIVPWSKLIRRSLVQKNSIVFDDVKYSNDVMFSVKCGNASRSISVSPDAIYYSTSTDGSLIKSKNEESFFTRLEVNCRYFSFVSDYATKEQKKYLSSAALLRTYYTILHNGYGMKGIMKYTNMLKQNHISAFSTLFNPIKTYQIKKRIKR